MAGMNPGEAEILTQAAAYYASVGEEILGQALRRQYSVQELAQFMEGAISQLLGNLYVGFREHLGKDEAEQWLKKTLGVASGVVRMRGSDAVIKFEVTIKDMPNKLHKPAAKAPAQGALPAASAAPACACKLDAENRCAACALELENIFEAIFTSFRSLKEINQPGKVCDACRGTQADFALSKNVPEWWAVGENLEPEQKTMFAQELLAILYQIAAMQGVRAIPITEKTWGQVTGAIQSS